ncbi:MAG: type II secretion system protein GspN [Bdellovibrionota bacterium]
MATDALDTNLLRSNKGSKPAEQKTETPAMTAALTRKRVLKIAAYAAFFLWSVVTFTLLKIPDSVVTNFLLNTLNQSTPYQWQAEKIALGFFPLPHLRMDKLSLEPKFPGQGVPLSIDEIKIYPNPFSLIPIGGSPSFGGSFSAEAYKAVVKGSFSTGSGLYLKVETDAVDLGKLTPLAQSGVDLKGQVSSLYFQINMPNQRVAMADGEIQIKGKNITFDPSTLSLPIALPILNLGEVDVQGTIARGQLKLEKFKVGGPGKDLDLQIPSGTVMLADVVPNTRYDLHLTLKPSATIEKVVPGIGGMLGTFSTLKPDGSYAMRLQGMLSAPAFPSKD